MEDDQGTATLSPDTAVDAELARIIRAAESHVQTYAVGYRPWLYRVIRTVRPEITRDRWREIAGTVPDISLTPVPEEQDEAQRRRDADVALMRQHGHTPCCPQCDEPYLVRLRGQETLPVDVPDPVHERTCECRQCTDEGCDGECDSCDEHECQQCYPSLDHEVSDCCGYCEGCEIHPNNTRSPQYDRCSGCDHCSECDHYCG